ESQTLMGQTLRAGPSRSLTSAVCRSLHVMLIFAALAAAGQPAKCQTSGSIEHAIAPGQEELLKTLLGYGATFPGECHFTGGQAEGAIVSAEYTCGEGHVIVELRYPDDAPPGALRTAQFAVIGRSVSVPPGFLDALAARIRSHETGFRWKQLPGNRSPLP